MKRAINVIQWILRNHPEILCASGIVCGIAQQENAATFLIVWAGILAVSRAMVAIGECKPMFEKETL